MSWRVCDHIIFVPFTNSVLIRLLALSEQKYDQHSTLCRYALLAVAL